MQPEILYGEPCLVGRLIDRSLSEEEIEKYRSLKRESMSDAEKKEWDELALKAADAVRQRCTSAAWRLYGWPENSKERDPTPLSFDIMESMFSLPENVITAPDGTCYRSCLVVPEGATWLDSDVLMAGSKPLYFYHEKPPRWFYAATPDSISSSIGLEYALVGPKCPKLRHVAALLEAVTLVIKHQVTKLSAGRQMSKKWGMNADTLKGYMKNKEGNPQWVKDLVPLILEVENSTDDFYQSRRSDPPKATRTEVI